MASSERQLVQRNLPEVVIASDTNFYRDRLVTASADHAIRVWNLHNDEWQLCDTWKPHTAVVTDVRWNGPYNGSFIGSISEDGTFKLWQENPSQLRNSGHRFGLLHTIKSKTPLPWSCLEFKNVGTDTYLALITNDGNLTTQEPQDQENLAGDWTDWMAGHEFWVCDPIPARSEETAFRLSFDPDPLPCYKALVAGLSPKCLSLAVSTMDTVKIYRTNGQKQLHLVAELKDAHDLIRDVAWAEGGSIRGHDTIATASKDGFVRIYELHTLAAESEATRATRRGSRSIDERRHSSSKTKQTSVSGIGVELTDSQTSDRDATDTGLGGLRHRVTLIDSFDVENEDRDDHDSKEYDDDDEGYVSEEEPSAIWRVYWTEDGDVLVAVGNDHKAASYKRALNGRWQSFSGMKLQKPPTVLRDSGTNEKYCN